ncbi:Luminal-binding protein 1 (Fragment) [Linum perenne]
MSSASAPLIADITEKWIEKEMWIMNNRRSRKRNKEMLLKQLKKMSLKIMIARAKMAGIPIDFLAQKMEAFLVKEATLYGEAHDQVKEMKQELMNINGGSFFVSVSNTRYKAMTFKTIHHSACVFQGDRPLTNDCIDLGSVELNGITPTPRGVIPVDVTFELDVDGILTVKERKPSAKSKSFTIIDYKGCLTHAEIERMIREAKMMAEEDQLAKARVEAMNMNFGCRVLD